MKLFDSHLHLNHPDFAGHEESVWFDANDAGVIEGVVIGYDLKSSKKAIELANRLPGLYASIGVSPHDILNSENDYLDELRSMAANTNVVAIGETGLEYHHQAAPKEMQKQYLIQHIELANKIKKPVVIHLREADDDFLDILQTNPPSSAILHCFTSSERVMRSSVSLGYMISISGIVTFKKAEDIQAVSALIPSENLLIETDAPYLAPIPYRGKQCVPRMLVETAKRIAVLRAADPEEIGMLTTSNARRIFQIGNRDLPGGVSELSGI